MLRRRRAAADVRRAWAAHDAGDDETALALLRSVVDTAPSSAVWFDLGLLHKLRRDWPASLAANLEARRLDDGNAEAAWNGGIAATALGEWETARLLWAAYGVRLRGTGEPVEPMGTAPVRVGVDDAVEVVWCTRLDPARARVENVPTPACDRRWGDVVLHDGVPAGERFDGRAWVPVFDEIALWRRSPVPRLQVQVRASSPAEVQELSDLFADAGRAAQDWTGTVRRLCPACSEGRPDPAHDHPPMDDWSPDRAVGLGCEPERARELLDRWSLAGAGRGWSDLETVG